MVNGRPLEREMYSFACANLGCLWNVSTVQNRCESRATERQRRHTWVTRTWKGKVPPSWTCKSETTERAPLNVKSLLLILVPSTLIPSALVPSTLVSSLSRHRQHLPIDPHRKTPSLRPTPALCRPQAERHTKGVRPEGHRLGISPLVVACMDRISEEFVVILEK
jgi:hypothetical protein